MKTKEIPVVNNQSNMDMKQTCRPPPRQLDWMKTQAPEADFESLNPAALSPPQAKPYSYAFSPKFNTIGRKRLAPRSFPSEISSENIDNQLSSNPPPTQLKLDNSGSYPPNIFKVR